MRERTEQEEFWSGEFGVEYIARNRSDQLLASNLSFFVHSLKLARKLNNCIEFGANVGMNLKALKILYPGIDATGIEINETAASELVGVVGSEKSIHSSFFDWRPKRTYELALIKGVLIHVNPDLLPTAYDLLYETTSRFILVAEYYNRIPASISYRGHEQRLFKRDFAGEILDRFADLRLIDYGFVYHRDPSFPQDDINWFLMEKLS